jgi:hypothetical protein
VLKDCDFPGFIVRPVRCCFDWQVFYIQQAIARFIASVMGKPSRDIAATRFLLVKGGTIGNKIESKMQ